VDITATRDKKLAALLAHKSQNGEQIWKEHHEIMRLVGVSTESKAGGFKHTPKPFGPCGVIDVGEQLDALLGQQRFEALHRAAASWALGSVIRPVSPGGTASIICPLGHGRRWVPALVPRRHPLEDAVPHDQRVE
jgi:hypothetical protein